MGIIYLPNMKLSAWPNNNPPQKSSIINSENKCPTIGYIRDHDTKYLLRCQPANTLCHGPADPWRWAEDKMNIKNDYIAVVVSIPACEFHDDDEVHLNACRYVIKKLEFVTQNYGYVISNLGKGGIEMDWGMILECSGNNGSYIFDVSFIVFDNENVTKIIVQFHKRIKKLWLFRNHSGFDQA